MTTNNHTAISTGAVANASTINTPLGELDAAIGNRATLGIAGTPTIVAAIGTAAMTTTAQTVIGAVNEHQTTLGTVALTTTATTLRGAVNELDGEMGNLASLTTTAKSTAVAAINELDAQIGSAASSSGSIGTSIDTDGTLKAGAVDVEAVLVDNVVTAAKIADNVIGASYAAGTDLTLEAASDRIGAAASASGSIGTSIDTDGTLKANAVDVAAVLADGIITNDKLATDVKIGSLSTLTTAAKGNVVAAINELDTAIDALVAPTGDDIAEIVAARGGHPTLDDRLDTLAVAAGISGGQTIAGGTAANDDLILNGTSHATKTTSYVLLQSAGGYVGIGTSAPGQALDIAYGNLRFTPVTDAGAPTVAVAAGGSVTDGDHYYKVSFVTATGETHVGSATAASPVATTGGGNNTVNLSNIPVSSAPSVIARKIYRTKAGGSTYWLLATIADNTTTTYTDTAADASLTDEIAVYRENTTAGIIYSGSDQAGVIGAQGVVGLGYRALRSMTSGIRNTALGGYALEMTTSGRQNVAIGTHALNFNTTGVSNSAVGFYAAEGNLSGVQNVAVGAEALRYNTVSSNNVAVGNRAAWNTTGGGNVAVGASALQTNTSGILNVALGTEAGYHETGSQKLFIDNQSRGSEANGRSMSLIYGVFHATPLSQTLTFNAKVGINTTAPGQALDIAYGNLRFTSVPDAGALTIGSISAGGSVDDGNHYYRVTFVTAEGETTTSTTTSAVATTGGGNNTVNLTGIPVSPVLAVTARKIYRTKAGGSTYWLLATIADNTTTTYTDTTADASLTDEIAVYRENTTAGRIYNGSQPIGFVGPQGVVGLGLQALANMTSGIRNTAIGAYALQLCTTGGQNAAFGTHALNSNTTGASNSAVGYYAAEGNLTGVQNVAVGAEALRYNTASNNNVAVGNRAAWNTTGGGNVAVGASALQTNTSGILNVALGTEAGYHETGSQKLFIDNQSRGSEANGRSMSLIYGVFHATSTSQEIRFNVGKMGFYGQAPVARPTGVAVDAAGIHAALVTLGLITA